MINSSAPYRALLRATFLISDMVDDPSINVGMMTEYLRECQKTSGENCGLERLHPADGNTQINLAFLHERGLIYYKTAEDKDLSKDAIKITEFGKAFASRIRFPENLEKAIREKIKEYEH